MYDRQDLLSRIEEYCRVAGIAESTFGRKSVNDGKFVGRLRDGKRVTTSTVDRIQAFLETQGFRRAGRVYRSRKQPTGRHVTIIRPFSTQERQSARSQQRHRKANQPSDFTTIGKNI